MGTNLLLTTTSISRDIGIDPITRDVTTRYFYTDTHASLALRIGGGLSVEVPIGRSKKIVALVKAAYLYGSHATYYARPRITDTQIMLAPRSTGTSMVLAPAGIKFYMFNGVNKQKDGSFAFILL
ncbi:MAG: hypothetical protein ABI237_09845 [Ginsengibacter sp.]